MFHLPSNIPQARINAVAATLCDAVEECVAEGTLLGCVPESHLYLAVQRANPITIDDWQAIAMAMVATKRVTLKGHAFRVAVKRIPKARKAAAA